MFPTEHEFNRNSVGKGNVLYVVFGLLLGLIRMGLGTGTLLSAQFSSVQLLSRVRLFVIP